MGPLTLLDRLQRRRAWLGLPLAIIYKFFDDRGPRAAGFGYSSSPAARAHVSHDAVAGRPDFFDRKAESVVTCWAAGIRAGVEVTLAPPPPEAA